MRGVGKVRGDRGVKKCGMYNDVKKQFFCTCFFLPRFFMFFCFFYSFLLEKLKQVCY